MTVIQLGRSMEVNVKVVRIIPWVSLLADVFARGTLRGVAVTRVSMDTGICDQKTQMDAIVSL